VRLGQCQVRCSSLRLICARDRHQHESMCVIIYIASLNPSNSMGIHWISQKEEKYTAGELCISVLLKYCKELSKHSRNIQSGNSVILCCELLLRYLMFSEIARCLGTCIAETEVEVSNEA
jgi:hypothetical protein